VLKRILIVDDDGALSEVLRDKLVIEGFSVQCAMDADEALRTSESFMPDLVLLDVMLPKRSGFELVPLVRQSRKIPIIFLSARGLLARIRAVLRRAGGLVDVIRLGGITIDFVRHRAIGPAGAIALTNREFEILQFLAERPKRTVHRDQLIQQVWGSISPGTMRSVDRAIARLREKIEPDTKHPRHLITAYGDGYSLHF
jgi:DNA-binding response OmpR family regulator